MPERISHKDIGDLWTPQATFQVGSTPTDPTTLVVKVKNPTGTVTTTTESNPAALTPSSSPIQRVSAGVFKHAGISLNDAGYWQARFEGTGAVVAAEDDEIVVDPSEFYDTAEVGTRALVGLREAKDWLNQQQINTGEDWEIARVINDISDRFHQEAEREFKVVGTNPQTRTFVVENLGRRMPYYVDGDYLGDRNRWARTIRIGDLATLTSVSILDTDWTTVLEAVAAGDVTAHPLNRQQWEPITELEFQSDVTALGYGMRVSVTGSWGFPSVPGDVRQAVLEAVASVLDRDVEHYRTDLGPVAQQTGGGSTVIMVGQGRQRFVSMPPSALAVAWRYRDLHVG